VSGLYTCEGDVVEVTVTHIVSAHFAEVAGTLGGAIRLGACDPVTASPSIRQIGSTAEAENAGTVAGAALCTELCRPSTLTRAAARNEEKVTNTWVPTLPRPIGDRVTSRDRVVADTQAC
jgi:hypothetical protein